MELQSIDFCSSLKFDPWLKASSSDSLLTEGDEPLECNYWSFFQWDVAKKEFGTIDRLYAALQDLRDEIQNLKEKYREESVNFPAMSVELNRERGVAGSYFLCDDEGNKRYLIKPLDEDAGSLHSSHYPSPLTTSPFRRNMPLYRSVMREVLAYRVAKSIGIESVVPKTEIGIIESESFHDLGEHIFFPKERMRYYDKLGPADKEKLCSVQEYVPHSKTLFEAIHDFEMASLTDEEIAERFDQKNFEQVNILLWATYDTDGHAGNFLVYPTGVDEIGNEILGIKKIDNGLAFPDKNEQFRNKLSHLPNAKISLSSEGKATVLNIDVEKLAKQFEEMGLESAIPALKERIAYLKDLVKCEGITIKEIHKKISKIGKKQ